VLAVPFHIYRGEAKVIAVPVLRGVLAAFVAWAFPSRSDSGTRMNKMQ
jgi:hypothetical protein